MDRSRAAVVRHPPHQPRPSHAREPGDLRGPPRLCRRRRGRPGAAMSPRRLAGGLAAVLILTSCGENNPLSPDATPSAPAAKGKPAAAGMTKTGVDQIDLDNGGILRGRKVGLLMHAASVTADGRRTVDALRAKDVNVV